MTVDVWSISDMRYYRKDINIEVSEQIINRTKQHKIFTGKRNKPSKSVL